MEDEKREYLKMRNGETYNATDAYLLKFLNECKDKCWEYNRIRPSLVKER